MPFSLPNCTKRTTQVRVHSVQASALHCLIHDAECVKGGSTMRRSFKVGVAGIVMTVAGAGTIHAQIRFQAMDTNNDRIITRDEWRGSDRDFRNQDWDGDGQLSGEEVRPGARRQTSWNQ